jgi:hypothetical protein
VAIIFGLLDTFYDEQAPFHEVRASLRRIITTLRELRQQNISVLLASLDLLPASAERAVLFPLLAGAMDRVYRVLEEDGRPKILEDGRLPVRALCTSRRRPA